MGIIFPITGWMKRIIRKIKAKAIPMANKVYNQAFFFCSA
jgi:hypothetical protein